MKNKSRSSASLLQRVLSGALAFILTLGVLPLYPVQAAAPEDGMPSQIKLASCKYGVGGSNSQVSYTSPNGMGSCLIHVFDMDVGGAQTAGFCTEHEKIMGNKYVGKTWSYLGKEGSGTKPYQPFMDWWEYHYELSVEADAKYPDKSTEEKTNLVPGYWDQWNRSVANTWVQASVWLGRSGKLTNHKDKSQLLMLAKERQACLKRLGYTSSIEDCSALINTIVEQWEANKYGKRNYYEYSPSNSRLQRMLIPNLKTTRLDGYLKLNKSSGGTPLKGAQFMAYEDSACKIIAGGPVSTNATGEAVIKVSITTPPDKTGRATQTFYVKEVKAPIGYDKNNSVFSVTVDSKANSTEATAALVNGGTPINNVKSIPDPPGGCTIKKIDKATGKGVGIAWFKFQGTAYDNSPVNISFPTDEAGNLKLQWVDPNDRSAPYILPGEYTVTEEKAPLGYERDTQAQHVSLTLKKDEHTGTEVPLINGSGIQNGCLVFKNAPMKVIVVDKVDAQTGAPLPGAVFSVSYNGKYVCDIETDDAGQAVFDGVDHKGAPTGWYEFTEIVPPAGYKLPLVHSKSIYVDCGGDIDEDGAQLPISTEPIHLSFKNSKYPEIVIKKTIAETDEPLAGAVFHVTVNGHDFGNLGPTGVDGFIFLTYEDYGEFLPEGNQECVVTVEEVTAPAGYLLNKTPQTKVLKADQTLLEFTFGNYHYPEVVIEKIDRDTGKPLANAEFNVWFNDKQYPNTVKTNAEGKFLFTWDQLKGYLDEQNDHWTVTVQETKAPDGYLINQTAPVKKELYRQTRAPLEFHFENSIYPTIVIEKWDLDSGNKLPGAEFEMTIDGVPFKDGKKLVTGPDGTVQITYAEYKDYLDTQKDDWTIAVRETQAPQGFLLNDSSWHTQELHKTQGYVPFVFPFYDSEHPYIRIRKFETGTNNKLGGAQFEVKINGNLISDRITTDASGEAIISWGQFGKFLDDTLDEYTVAVREVVAPNGYLIDNPQWQEIKVKKEQKLIPFDFSDTAYPEIHIKKVDAETGFGLGGAHFDVFIDGIKIGNFETLMDGTIDISYEKLKGYLGQLNKDSWTVKVVETKAPAGYLVNDPSEETRVVTAGQMHHPFIFSDTKYPTVQIIKEDAVSHKGLAGAEFELWADGRQFPDVIRTDEDGRFLLSYSDFMNFLPQNKDSWEIRVRETRAPEGYLIDSPEWQIKTLYKNAGASGHGSVVFKFHDHKESCIVITKVSSVSDEPLMGAKFLVKAAADGSKIGEFTTDVSGIATTPGLQPGDYLVKEVKAPDGYLLNEQEFRVTVKPGVNAPLVVVDEPATSLVIYKGDSNTGRGIPGAVFKVETADRDFIGQYTTDAQGEALVRPINPGHYIVTEMSPPEDYLVTDAPKTITVKAGVVNRVEFFDAKQGSLVIRLEDQADGHKLENGRFELYWAATGEKVAEGVTDNSGSITWGNLNPGRYIIKQTYAPDGYTIIDKELSEFVVSGDTKIVVFKDATAGIVIEKIDRLTSKMLPGARFQLVRNSDDIVIGEYVTGNDGLALVSGLKPGMYTVRELEAPVGYAIDEPSSKTVEVKVSTQAHVTFKDTPLAGITVTAVDKDTNAPLSGAVFEVWHQNGTLVNTYTTDTTGVIHTEALPAGFYVIKAIKAENGAQPVTAEQTVEIKNGIPVSVKFEFISRGVLQIYALNNQEQGLPGMKVTVTKQNGEFVGNYTVDSTGLVRVTNLEPGWYVVKETKCPNGYTMQGNDSQSIEVTSNGTAVVKFYHGKTMCLQIRTSVKQTGEMVPGVKYEITQMDGKVVGTYVSDKSGLVYADLNPGWYVIKPVTLPEGAQGYELPAARNVQVLADKVTIVDFQLTQMSSIRVRFVDGQTNTPIFGIRVLLKDRSGKVLDDYTSNNEGYITLKQSVLNGSYTLEQIAVPSGYTVDRIPKSIDVLNGQTTEVVWKMYSQSGQIQVHVVSSAYNSTLDVPAGTNLQGAVFEIYDPFTFAVVSTITSDSHGVAASQGLPIGRYIIREASPAPYYKSSGKQTEVYLKISNDVVRVEYQQSPVPLGSAITMRANKSVSAGTSMKYVFSAVNNNSGARLDNFFWSIKVPTDAMRAGTLYTGKWSAPVLYNISYKTNMQDYRPLAQNLSSSNAYQYDLSSLSLNVQGGEYVTDIRFEFGTVPAGFKPTVSPVFFGYVMPNVPNAYKVIMRTECGGKYGAAWVSASGLWTTNVVNNSKNSSKYPSQFPSKLPTTGY